MTYHSNSSSYTQITYDTPDRIDTVSKAVRRTSDCVPACTDDACNSGGSTLMGVKFEINKNCISCNTSKYTYDYQ